MVNEPLSDDCVLPNDIIATALLDSDALYIIAPLASIVAFVNVISAKSTKATSPLSVLVTLDSVWPPVEYGLPPEPVAAISSLLPVTSE